jgi:hypothetical protein
VPSKYPQALWLVCWWPHRWVGRRCASPHNRKHKAINHDTQVSRKPACGPWRGGARARLVHFWSSCEFEIRASSSGGGDWAGMCASALKNCAPNWANKDNQQIRSINEMPEGRKPAAISGLAPASRQLPGPEPAGRGARRRGLHHQRCSKPWLRTS